MIFDKEKLLSVFDQTTKAGHRPGPDAPAGHYGPASGIAEVD